MNTIETVGKACTGCAACAQACPKDAITMRANAEGFLFPVIDQAACVQCGRCQAVCAQMTRLAGNAPLAVYAAHATEEAVLKNSSSGGLFSVAAREIFQNGGVVCAVRFQKDTFRAEFGFAKSEDELAAMRGSKYVQADVGNAYAQVKRLLAQGCQVLFVGCACHVAGLKLFLGGEAQGLFTIDIICHGVPSPLMFQKYAQSIKERAGALTDYCFRDKRHGWGMRLSYTAGGRKRNVISTFDPYNFNFLKCRTYRESCYQCQFACAKRHGDWTIGDYWGVLKEHPEFYSQKGVSALLVNTPQGQQLLEKARANMNILPSTFDAVARHNENLLRPSTRPMQRDTIYSGINDKTPAAFVRENLRVQNKAVDCVKALVPGWVKQLCQRRANK